MNCSITENELLNNGKPLPTTVVLLAIKILTLAEKVRDKNVGRILPFAT